MTETNYKYIEANYRRVAGEVLRGMYDLLSPGPDRWTKEADARDKDGEPTMPRGPFATCYCLSGACNAVFDRLGYFNQPYAINLFERVFCHVNYLIVAEIPDDGRFYYEDEDGNEDEIESMIGFNDHEDCDYVEMLTALKHAMERTAK